MKQDMKFIKSEKQFSTDDIVATVMKWRGWDIDSVDEPVYREIIDRLEAMDKLCEAAQRKINIQAMDEGLWFVAITASEEYLQNALRELHAIIKQAIAGYEKGQS